ncbi:DnaT-like ssDNA-binding domain-containing protein [Enterobacter hormaechei]|uniref:DnaT-like ssDNA-binding domain-containing protein n=1 Tax=Enterobacter hormaechei TaxID=158836 RepID=UPI0007969C20|nr:DnaT-like ssDNA-binding domain-containing protein [Enterobacter hormaechei]WMA51900.1 DnaT-like ssDNA-binding domain-containing protein [Enterobacter hormaechei]SAD85934.1 Pyocin large subunit-like protein [Enterobacter hormaechei]
MASSWIKVEVITPDKPEIFQIAEQLNIDPDAVLGKLVRIWTWADQQTIDGNAGSVTKGVLDRLAFITGFADALIAVGWLAYEDGKLVLPNFERHNGESSKKRALTNRRVAEHRKRETHNVTLAALQKALPEEEEEEDINKTPLSPREGIQIPPVIVPGIGEPIGKFTMHEKWTPSDDFVMRARMWGHALPADGYKKSDLIEFITYWMAEGNVMQHVQWEQKFARLLMNRRKRAAGKRGDSSDDDVPHWNSPEGWKGFL